MWHLLGHADRKFTTSMFTRFCRHILRILFFMQTIFAQFKEGLMFYDSIFMSGLLSTEAC